MGMFASGGRSTYVCDRCSQRYRGYYMTKEPGTHLWVCPRCNDRNYSMVDHPQNKPPPVTPDPIALKNARPEVCTGFTQTVWDGNTTVWDQWNTLWDQETVCPTQPGG